jgi:hypothetical protein
MAKYTFSKPYSTKVGIGGIVGVKTYSWNIGDVIDAEPFTSKNPSDEPQVRYLVNPNPIQGGQMFAYIPLSVLTLASTSSDKGSAKNSNPSFWTPMKKGIAAVLAIGAIYAIMKRKKGK